MAVPAVNITIEQGAGWYGGGGGSNGINVPGGRNLSGSSSNGAGGSDGTRRIVLTW